MEKTVGQAKKQQRCPSCRRAMQANAKVCSFCGKALMPTAGPPRADAAQKRVAPPAQRKPDLRAIFPLLNYEGEPLPRQTTPAARADVLATKSGEGASLAPLTANVAQAAINPFQYPHR